MPRIMMVLMHISILAIICSCGRKYKDAQNLHNNYSVIKTQLPRVPEVDSCKWLSEQLSANQFGPTPIRIYCVGYINGDIFNKLWHTYTWAKLGESNDSNMLHLPLTILNSLPKLNSLYESNQYTEYILKETGYIGRIVIDTKYNIIVYVVER